DEPQLLDRDALVEAPEGVVDVDPGFDQVGGHPMRGRTGVLVHEPPRVGDEGDVQSAGDVGRDLGPEAAGDAVDDLGRAGGVGVDEVDRPEAGVVVVVVDVEDGG